MGCCRGLELLRVDTGAFPEVQLLRQGVTAQGKQPFPGVGVACTRSSNADHAIVLASYMSSR